MLSESTPMATRPGHLHFLAPVVVGPARAEATIVRAGKRLIVTAVDVIDVARNRLAARATLSFAVLERALNSVRRGG